MDGRAIGWEETMMMREMERPLLGWKGHLWGDPCWIGAEYKGRGSCRGCLVTRQRPDVGEEKDMGRMLRSGE